MLCEVARAIRASTASYGPEGREQSLPGHILLSLNSAYDVVAFVACCGELKARRGCSRVTSTWQESWQQSVAPVLITCGSLHDINLLGTTTMKRQHVAVPVIANGAGAIGGAAARSSLTCGVADSSRECVMPNVAILAMAGAAAFLIITLSQDVHGEPKWTQAQETEHHLCTSPMLNVSAGPQACTSCD